MYVHEEQGVFLSVYVDDFKMAGLAPNAKNMWPKIKTQLDLEPSEELNESVYLGCGQNDVAPQPQRYADKREFWEHLSDRRKIATNNDDQVKPEPKSKAKAKAKAKPKSQATPKQKKEKPNAMSSSECIDSLELEPRKFWKRIMNMAKQNSMLASEATTHDDLAMIEQEEDNTCATIS